MATVEENLTIISNSLKNIKSALGAKGVTVSGDITTYGDAIMRIPGTSRLTYLPCIRRVGTGYIDTGVSGANSNLRIEISYSLNTLPSGYFNLFHAYVDDNTNATRAMLNGSSTTYCSLNSKAGNSLTATIKRVTGRIYTESLFKSSSSMFVYYSTGGAGNSEITNGNSLNRTNTIKIFQSGTDSVDINLYSFRIYDQDVLIKDYVPCLIGGDYGMIDTLTGQFKVSASGAFVDSGQVLPMDIE